MRAACIVCCAVLLLRKALLTLGLLCVRRGVTLEGEGENMLGKMLMERRSELAAENSAAAAVAAAAAAAAAKPAPKPAPKRPAAVEVIELLDSDSDEPVPAHKPSAKRQKA